MSVPENYFSGLNTTHYNQRYYSHAETNNPGHSYLSHPTESVPLSVPIINTPSPQRKRKRSIDAQSTQTDSQQLTNKGKAIDLTPPTEGAIRNQNSLENDGVVRCICEIQVDDGFTIQCESCQVWQHAACMRIHSKAVPQVYLCERCNPRLVDGVRARRALLSRLQAKAKQVQIQERKKQVRRTSSETTSKRGKGTASVSPQPQGQQPTLRRKSSTSLTSPVQPHPLLPPESRLQNPYLPHNSVVTKDEVLSPITPLVPTADSSTSTPSTLYNLLPVRQSSQSLHILQPRIDNLETSCRICGCSPEANVKCDHASPPLISLHSDGFAIDTDGRWSQYRLIPTAVLRPFICGKGSSSPSTTMATSGSALQDDVKYAIKNGLSHIKLGVFALQDIKAGDEIVLGCEWESNLPNPFKFRSGSNTNAMSTILSNFTFCGCGCPTEPCITSQHSTLPFDTTNSTFAASLNQKPVPEPHAKKKPKPITKERLRKQVTGNAASTKEPKASINGKQKTATRKKETKEMDVDLDVDIDSRSEDVLISPLESSTDALASLSIRCSPEVPEQTNNSSHPESVVEAVLKLSTIQEQRSENHDPGVSPVRVHSSRASSISHSMLEQTSLSPHLSSTKPVSAPTVLPLLPSSAANANSVSHVLDSVTNPTNPSVAPPTLDNESQVAEEKNKPPIKRLSLADWKISKDREKQALRDAQEKTMKGHVTSYIENPTEQVVGGARTVTTGKGEESSVTDSDGQLVSRGITPMVDVDEKVKVITTSANGSEMGGLSQKGMMETGIMELDVDISDEYSREARQFTSPQVPSCSLQTDNSSDPQHTPLSVLGPAVDESNTLNRRSPFESCFEEGEIKSSPPLSSADPPFVPSLSQTPPRPPFCPPAQTSRPLRSMSPSRSPPTHPRSYHQRPPRSVSPFSSHGRPVFDGPQRNFASRPVPSAPRALRGGPPPRHPSSFSSSYRPNSYRSGLSRDYERYRGTSSSTLTQRSRDSSPHGDSSRPWRDPPWKR
ncbi:hypothetical protein Clacol_005956 [Clathrus columnatus]|uniref:Zinc finger PHD-type domain-containing protein n=1 Tax=Clathrus columnatus TaxID=1419009 RepID=A0AAV5AEV8_9AGAM|nr:hypothetical protein Clacol_005956 [Clathrus columnatus]